MIRQVLELLVVEQILGQQADVLVTLVGALSHGALDQPVQGAGQMIADQAGVRRRGMERSIDDAGHRFAGEGLMPGQHFRTPGKATLNWSARASTGLPSSCSGAM